MEQILEKLLESVPKARILRLFMQNPEQSFLLDDIVKRCSVQQIHARKELNNLVKFGIVSEKTTRLNKEAEKKRNVKNSAKGTRMPNGQGSIFGGKNKSKKIIQVSYYSANQGFEIFNELRDLVIKSSIASRKNLLRRVRKLGRIRLAIIAGILINNDRSRTDLLIIADDVKRGKIERFLSELESEIGKPVHYTLMNNEEFVYRTNMYDRFLRDILESPHEKLINRLNI